MSEGRHEGRTKIIGTVRKKVDRGPWIAESDIVVISGFRSPDQVAYESTFKWCNKLIRDADHTNDK